MLLCRRVWTSGLEWDLDGADASSLTFGQFISTSNRIRPHVSSPAPHPPSLAYAFKTGTLTSTHNRIRRNAIHPPPWVWVWVFPAGDGDVG